MSVGISEVSFTSTEKLIKEERRLLFYASVGGLPWRQEVLLLDIQEELDKRLRPNASKKEMLLSQKKFWENKILEISARKHKADVLGQCDELRYAKAQVNTVNAEILRLIGEGRF